MLGARLEKTALPCKWPRNPAGASRLPGCPNQRPTPVTAALSQIRPGLGFCEETPPTVGSNPLLRQLPINWVTMSQPTLLL